MTKSKRTEQGPLTIPQLLTSGMHAALASSQKAKAGRGKGWERVKLRVAQSVIDSALPAMPLHPTAGTESGSEDSALVIHGFLPDEDPGKIDIIRFLPLDRFLAQLEFQAMWFSRLGALQDGFECTTPGGARAFVFNLEADTEAVVTLNNYHSGCLNPDGSQPYGVVFSPDIKGLYIKCDLKGLIRSVIVGPNSNTNFRMLVKRIIARYGLTIEVEYSQIPPVHNEC